MRHACAALSQGLLLEYQAAEADRAAVFDAVACLVRAMIDGAMAGCAMASST